MKHATNREHEVKEVQYASELDEVNRMLSKGWIYLEYYRTRVVQVLGEAAAEVPVFILGRV
jgi:hypothetical protein